MVQAFDLSGQRVAITGAGGGIGSETARLVAGMGADVLIADLEAPEPLADYLRSQGRKSPWCASQRDDQRRRARTGGDPNDSRRKFPAGNLSDGPHGPGRRDCWSTRIFGLALCVIHQWCRPRHQWRDAFQLVVLQQVVALGLACVVLAVEAAAL